MSLQDKQSQLEQFTGTEAYTRWSPLFRRMVLTDGAKFVAENGGNGAYWIMDAIASHQPKALKNEMLRDIQFWTLEVIEKVGRKGAVLTCRVDSGEEPVITQKIEYTDFDLPKIDLWAAPLDGKTYVIMLPTEY